MTTMLSLILAFMLSIGGSPAAGVNPGGCPGDTGIQAPIDNNRTINHFSGDYNQKTASRAKSKKAGEAPSIKDLETVNSTRSSRFSIEKLRQVRYSDHKSYRFNSVDPVINKIEALYNPQAWNLYAYCNNNPITYYDPDGRLIIIAPWLLNPATIAAITAAATAGAIATHNLVKSIDIDEVVEDVIEVDIAVVKTGLDILSSASLLPSAKLSEMSKNDDANEKGGGKTGRKINKKRLQSLKEQEEAAKTDLKAAKNKGEKKIIKKRLRHLRRKQKKSELHTGKEQGYKK